MSGAWRDENGEWSSSCLHYSLQNYTLDVWEGYYKSINSMKYCDFSFGPLLLRSNVYTEFISRPAEIIDFHLRNPNLRSIMCPDCMFYMHPAPPLTKDSFLLVSRKYMLNIIRFPSENFEFTCPEGEFKIKIAKLSLKLTVLKIAINCFVNFELPKRK